MSQIDILKLAVNFKYYYNRMNQKSKLYYIDKKWYDNWIDYVNMDYIKLILDNYYNSEYKEYLNIKQFIEMIRDEYTPKTYNTIIPKGPINKEIKYIPKEKMFKNKKVIDETFYIKIPKECWKLLKNYYGYENELKVHNDIKFNVIIFNKNKNELELKYYYPDNNEDIMVSLIEITCQLFQGLNFSLYYIDISENEFEEKKDSLINYIEENYKNNKFERCDYEYKKYKNILLYIENLSNISFDDNKTENNSINNNNFHHGNIQSENIFGTIKNKTTDIFNKLYSSFTNNKTNPNLNNNNQKNDNNINNNNSNINNDNQEKDNNNSNININKNNKKNNNETININNNTNTNINNDNEKNDNNEIEDYEKEFIEDNDIINDTIDDELIAEGINKSNTIKKNEYLKKKSSSSLAHSNIIEININELYGTMGIVNIGNNCFMNSVFQCLSNIFPLTQYLISNEYINEINPYNSLSSNGNIIIAFTELLKVLWNTKLNITKLDGKPCYYYDQMDQNNSKIMNVFKNLKDEIGKNNIIYNDYQQHDAIEFFTYFLDIIHEDLKRINNNPILPIDNLKEKNVEILFKNRWDIFKNNNNSIISDIFYSMNHTSILCSNCLNTYHIFEPFSIIFLPLNESLNKANKEEVESVKKKQFIKQSTSTIPGKSNFYFCTCIIMPYNLSKGKMIIKCPIKKINYDIVKVKDILYMIVHILNLKNDDLVPCILSDDFYSYKIICSGEEYLYEIFKNPTFIKIYFVQQNNKDIQLDKNYMDSNNLLHFFMNPEKKIANIFNREHDNFIIGEEEIKISEHTLISEEKEKKINSNKTCYFKILSFITNQNNNINLICLQVPTILKFNFSESLEKLHTSIRKLFNLPIETNFYTFSSLEKLTYNNVAFDNFDIRKLLLKDNELKNNPKIHFVLCIKIEPNTYYNRNFKNNEEFYIPIPYIAQTLDYYITFLQQRITFCYSNKYKLKKLRIHVIWLNNHKNYIENIERNCEVNDNEIEIDPYNELLREIQERSENRMLNPLLDTKMFFFNKIPQLDLYKLLKYYTDFERYDKNNIYHCGFCNEDVIGFKQTLLYNLPDVLIFHFQRKSLGEYNNIIIKFPIKEHLDLSRFAEDNKTKDKKYELIGIINFEGNMVTGHYNAFCKNPIQNKWFKFNDTACFIINNIEEEIDYSNVYAVIYKNIEFNEYKK